MIHSYLLTFSTRAKTSAATAQRRWLGLLYLLPGDAHIEMLKGLSSRLQEVLSILQNQSKRLTSELFAGGFSLQTFGCSTVNFSPHVMADCPGLITDNISSFPLIFYFYSSPLMDLMLSLSLACIAAQLLSTVFNFRFELQNFPFQKF